MPRVTIKIYREDGGAAPSEYVLIRTLNLETSSAKQLTGKRAGQILANHFPEFESARQGMIKSNEGWVKKRAIQPTKGCSYHYIWEHAMVTQENEDAAEND